MEMIWKELAVQGELFLRLRAATVPEWLRRS